MPKNSAWHKPPRLTIAALAWSAISAHAGLLIKLSNTQGEPLLDAVAYALPIQKSPLKPPTAETPIDQVNKEFTPRVSVIQTGTSVQFPNKDNIRHHVYSFSPAKTFDLKLYSGTPSKPVQFDQPGLVVLGCNIHDWMLAYVLVVETPYFGKAGADGTVKLDGLPPGDYELKAWHPNLEGAQPTQKIRVGGDASYQLRLKISAAVAPASKP